MSTYTTPHCHPVESEDIRAAAKIFADRLGRRAYGKRGYARTCQMESCAQDMHFAEFSAFIGTTSHRNPHETTGHNIHFTIYTQ